ncbi:hypothetical protein JCM19046_3927 [Bacillus sp. JCM 19046]|nr:hypothetical protein JCM19045_2976 [Bacillus sp. JCM 19045]GAF19288.1 hypothetical protein JCM19046_3927 [Bacillus sp. JCM 19046]
MGKTNFAIQAGTKDEHLVEMSGLHAYLGYEINSIIRIDDSQFRVANVHYNDPSGLDALTVQSIETEEIFIIYVGTDFHGKYGWKDIETNINLLNEVIPAQLEAADDYYVEMEKKFGEISAVAGNSLGGALANGVAIEHEVRSVTLNPALLPDGMIDPNKDYSYMTNYIGEYDILNQALRAGGLDNRVPGNQHTIYNGVALKSAIGPNHTGYARDENGQHVPYITIGKKGYPGYGRIYMDAHSHIVTSLWTGQPLYGGSGQRIAINHETLLQLGESMETTVLERLNLARDYINHSLEIVDDQAAKFPERVNSLREIFLSLFESADGGTLLQGINGGTAYLSKWLNCCIQLLIRLRRVAGLLM